MHTAQTLFAGSTILARESERARANLRRGGKAPIELLTTWTELMLAAFGIECLIKAIWVKQGNSLARNGKYVPMLKKERHQLVPLCRIAGIALDAREKDALERISIIARTIGRYPIPRHSREMPPLGWSSNDNYIIESFALRLKTELRYAISAPMA
jgi:hypothetical protein